jgi:hypothetical protein
MDRTIYKRLVLYLLICICLLFLIIFYRKIIFSPNQYIFASQGDAVKTSYYFASHIKNDTSYLFINTINYPYGEHIIYPDFQPFFVTIIKLVSEVFPVLNNYSIGILNWIMIMSFVIGVIFFYLIFVEFKLPPFYAAASAFCIILLSPQIFRLLGHLGMAYSCFFPVSWYLIIKFFNTGKKIKWTIWLLFNNLLWFFVHPYLGIMISFFLFLSWIFYITFGFRTQSKNFKNYLNIFVQIFLPILIFKLFVVLTDIYQDKTNDPWGLLSFLANPNTIFIPTHGPLRPIIDKLVKVGPQTWEAWAYVGFPSTILFIVLLLIIGFKCFRRDFHSIPDYFPGSIRIYLLAALVILAYSMGFPYILKIDIINKILHPLVHFRILGRFAWVFYYVFLTYCILIFYVIFQKLKNKKLSWAGITIILSALVLYFFEGLAFHKEVAPAISKDLNFFKYSNVDSLYIKAIDNIDRSMYQSILPFPFFHNGSANFEVNGTQKSKNISFIIAYYKNLPICGAASMRTSISRSKNIVQLLSPNFYKKEIFYDLPDKKPFLVVYSKEPVSSVYQSSLLQKSKLIYENDEFSLLELPFDSIFYFDINKAFKDFESKKESLFCRNNFYVTDTVNILYNNSFDTVNTSIKHRGAGSYKGYRKDYNIIARFDSGCFKPGIEYAVSLWYYNKGVSKNQSDLIVQEMDSNNISHWNYTTRFMECEVIDGDWSLGELKFFVSDSNSKLDIIIKGSERARDWIYIDDVLIRSSSNQVYRVLRDSMSNITELVINNQFIDSGYGY